MVLLEVLDAEVDERDAGLVEHEVVGVFVQSSSFPPGTSWPRTSLTGGCATCSRNGFRNGYWWVPTA